MLSAALLACAVGVAPSTMDAIVAVESGGHSLAMHVNGWSGVQPHADTVQEAVATAQRFIATGYSVDLGLGQLNSRNLSRFGMSVADAFDDCKNLAASGAVLSGFYGQAVQRFGEGQDALKAALSGYNTGDLTRGFSNGYVGKYYISASVPVLVSTNKKVAPPVMPFTTVAYDRPGYSVVIQ